MRKIPLVLMVCLLMIQCNSIEKTDGQETTGGVPSATQSAQPQNNQPAAGAKDQEQPENELILLVRENIQAAEDEDLEKAMRILDETKSNYEKNKEFTQRLFDLFDIDYEIESIKVIEQTGEEAKVALTQVMRKLSGPEFRDQRTSVILHFKKVNGQWKIEKRDVQNTIYL